MCSNCKEVTGTNSVRTIQKNKRSAITGCCCLKLYNGSTLARFIVYSNILGTINCTYTITDGDKAGTSTGYIGISPCISCYTGSKFIGAIIKSCGAQFISIGRPVFDSKNVLLCIVEFT